MEQTLNHQFKRITAELLDASQSPAYRMTQLEALSDLFCGNSDVDFKSDLQAHQLDTCLANGVAISPFLAGFCLKELGRTTKFLLGLKKAIQEAQNRFPGQRINVLYAGCGPFATLALPLCTMFESSEVGFTLLDIHEECIVSAQRLVSAMELEDWIDGYALADATRYQYDETKPLHLFVTETMQSKLAKEPQVAIMLNLVPQLVEGGVCVPENITLSVGFKKYRDPEDLLSVSWEKVGTLFEVRDHLDKNKIGKLPNSLPGNTLDIPACPVDCKDLYLFTDIEVFGGVNLAAMECSLTLPALLFDYDINSLPLQVESWYLLGDFPKLEINTLDF